MVSYFNAVRTAMVGFTPCTAVKLAAVAVGSDYAIQLAMNKMYGSWQATQNAYSFKASKEPLGFKVLNVARFAVNHLGFVAAASLVFNLTHREGIKNALFAATLYPLSKYVWTVASTKQVSSMTFRLVDALTRVTTAVGSLVLAYQAPSKYSLVLATACVLGTVPTLPPAIAFFKGLMKDAKSAAGPTTPPTSSRPGGKENPIDPTIPTTDPGSTGRPILRSNQASRAEEEKLAALFHKQSTQKGPDYPDRFVFEKPEYKLWSTDLPSYKPTVYTAPTVLNVDGDPNKPRPTWAHLQYDRASGVLFDKTLCLSSFLPMQFEDSTGLPLNPISRTGMCDRGLLGRYGPNPASDSMVYKIDINSDTNKPALYLLTVERGDLAARITSGQAKEGERALPGGMIEPSAELNLSSGTGFDTLMAAALTNALKELGEETDVTLVKGTFGKDSVCYAGVVDDPRNTDNAWMETIALDTLLPENLATKLKPKGGDDALHAGWSLVSPALLSNMFASHPDIIKRSLVKLLESCSDTRLQDPDLRASIKEAIDAK